MKKFLAIVAISLFAVGCTAATSTTTDSYYDTHFVGAYGINWHYNDSE